MTPAPSAVSVSEERFREVLGHLPTSVTVITAVDADGPVGMAVGTFTSVSLDPMLVGFLPTRTSRSWSRIMAAGSFCANILSSDQADLCARFASHDRDKFAGISWRPAGSGAPILPRVVAWVDCDIQSSQSAGDHIFVLGAVRDLGAAEGTVPLLFHRGQYGHVHHR